MTNKRCKPERIGVVKISNIINEESYEKFCQDLMDMLLNTKIDLIMVEICSSGGEVDFGIAIFEEIRLRQNQKLIATLIQGEAASIAAIIAQAGAIRYMTRFSTMVLHQPRFDFEQIQLTDIRLRTLSKRIKKLYAIILSILSEKTGKSVKELKRFIGANNKTLNAEEALEYGLVDEVI